MICLVPVLSNWAHVCFVSDHEGGMDVRPSTSTIFLNYKEALLVFERNDSFLDRGQVELLHVSVDVLVVVLDVGFCAPVGDCCILEWRLHSRGIF